VDGGNNKMLRFNKKGETIEQIEAGIRIACELGYDVKIFVITGMPHETEADIEDSIRLVRKYPVKRVILNNPIPYPGTELFDTVKANNWFITQPEEYLNFVTENENVPVFITPELGYEDRLRILKRIRQVEKEVTREAIARMFPKLPLLGRIAGAFFASDTVQRMFFLNLTFRRIMEWIRSRQWNVKRQKGQAGEISS